MRSVTLIPDRSLSQDAKGVASTGGKAGPKRLKLVHMGSALKETQGIGRGLEFLAYPKGA